MVAGLAGPVLLPAHVVRADEGESETKNDARLEGYGQGKKVAIDGGDSTALYYLLFAFAGVVGLSALFKDAKRSHLD